MTEQIHRLSEEQEDRILVAGGHLPQERDTDAQVESPEPSADTYDDAAPPVPPSGDDG